MARSILPEAPDGTPQILFYDAGVGTDDLLDMLSGGALGIGLSKNMRDAYRFLIHNYSDGDEIYFLGFSRGAYTVRSAAGLIRNCGLLHKENVDRIPEAFRIYRRCDGGADTEEAVAFRERYSRHPMRIKFIDVWDTVSALGIPSDLFRFLGRRRYEFHDVSLSRSVGFAYQAVAIDEQRTFYRPALWSQHPEATNQVLEQSWFAGVHMDIGGCYPESGLSDTAFLWMEEKAAATGLSFDRGVLEALTPDPFGRLHNSRTFPFNLIPPYSRPIGQGVRSQESVHPRALERHQKDSSYRPKNLISYLHRNPPT